MQLNDVQPGRWDIPLRILIGTTFIILLPETAPLLGSRLTGLLATIRCTQRFSPCLSIVSMDRRARPAFCAFVAWLIRLCRILSHAFFVD